MAAYRLIVIVPAAGQVAANAAARALDPVGGGRAFDTPLNATGDSKDPPTHVWCCWQLSDARRAQLQAGLAGIPGVTYDNRDAKTPDTVLTEKVLKRAEPGGSDKPATIVAESARAEGK